MEDEAKDVEAMCMACEPRTGNEEAEYAPKEEPKQSLVSEIATSVPDHQRETAPSPSSVGYDFITSRLSSPCERDTTSTNRVPEMREPRGRDQETSISRGMTTLSVFERGQWTPLPNEVKWQITHEENLAGLLESESTEIHNLDVPEYTPFHVVLDSGAADHVVNSTETPGYPILESAGSKAGACFVAANGERIPNRGQVSLRLRAGKIPISSTFQVSKISKPLWSVRKLCDAGFRVEFDKNEAKVTKVSTGKVVGSFPRSQGLYIGKMELKNPSTLQNFQRQA